MGKYKMYVFELVNTKCTRQTLPRLNSSLRDDLHLLCLYMLLLLEFGKILFNLWAHGWLADDSYCSRLRCILGLNVCSLQLFGMRTWVTKGVYCYWERGGGRLEFREMEAFCGEALTWLEGRVLQWRYFENMTDQILARAGFFFINLSWSRLQFLLKGCFNSHIGSNVVLNPQEGSRVRGL